jgi:ribA/ribD-fused uncharacterized protein
MLGPIVVASERDGVDPMTEKFTFFYGGHASQWAASSFVIDDITYNTAEQYMMAQKAILFNDAAALQIIMGTNNPKIQKAAGRTVQGWRRDLWEQNAKLYVYRANLAKFMQNRDYLEWLLSTEGTTLVEASPWDTIWGIGLDASDPRAQDRATWQGTNWLGEIVTQVRNDIMAFRAAHAAIDRRGNPLKGKPA